MLDLVLEALVAGGFVLLAGVAVRRHLEDRQPGAVELSVVLGVYATIAMTAGIQTAFDRFLVVEVATNLVMGAGLAVIPLLIVRFADVFAPIGWRWWRLLRGLSPVLLILALGFSVHLLGEVASNVFLATFLAVWAGVHGFAALRIVLGGRDASSTVARRRSELLGLGVFGLGATLPVAAATGALTGASVTLTLWVAVAAVGLFLVGFAPTAAIQWQWSRRDRGLVDRAERELATLDDPEALAEALLPHAVRIAGGTAAWLFVEGALVGAYPADRPAPATARGTMSGGEGVKVVALPGRHERLLVAPTLRGRLVVEVGPYALLFGARELDSFHGLATQIDVAVDRARLKANEVDSIRRLEAARRLHELDRIREDILATVSHEIRTPLTTILGASELLAARWDGLAEVQRRLLVDRLQANADDLRRVVDEIFDLTSNPGFLDDQAVRPVEVSVLLSQVVDGLGRVLTSHQVRVSAPPELVVDVDALALRQILEHVISNAAKFTPAPGVIEVSAEPRGDRLVVTVRDTGVGMSPDELERVFEPFYRAGDVLRRETRGVGLGMSVVAALAHRIGAKVSVGSSPGAGTTVSIVLPGVVASDPHPVAS